MRLFRLLKPWRCHPSTQDRWWPGGKKEPIIPDLGDLSAFHSRASQPAFYSDFNRRKKAVGGGPRFREIRGRLDWPLVLWMALKRPVYHLHRQIFSLHLRPARGNLTSRTFLILTFPFLRPRARDRDVSCRVVAWRGVAWREVARVFSRQPRGHLSSWIPLTNFDTLKIRGWGKKMKLVHYKRAKNVSLFFHVSLFLQGSYLGNTFTYLAYKFICKDGIERTIPKNHFNFLFDLRIGLHLFAFIQNFASSLKKKEKRKINSISLILCSNAVLR